MSLLTTIAIVVLSMQAIMTTRNSASAVIRDRIGNLLLAEDILAYFESRSAGLRSFLLSGDRGYQKERLAYLTGLKDSLRELRDREQSQQGQTMVDEIGRAATRYEKTIPQAIHSGGGRRSIRDLIAFFDAYERPVQSEIRSQLGSLVTFERKSLDDSISGARQASKRAMILFLSLAGSLILITVAFGAFMARALSRSHQRAESSLTRIKKSEEDKIRAIQARDELMAMVSHELKNPLSAIATGIEVVLRNQQKGSAEKTLNVIRSSVGRMSRLTSDLLDITKVEAGSLSLQKETHNVASLIAEAADSVQAVANEKRIQLKQIVPSGLPEICCDRDRIIQVLSNLLGNAIKFSASGTSITVMSCLRNNEFRFQVRDQGPGIPRDQIPKVFDRFWQAKQTAVIGTGLGLAISKGIVEAHGGEIWVKSRVGRGSVFAFTIERAA